MQEPTEQAPDTAALIYNEVEISWREGKVLAEPFIHAYTVWTPEQAEQFANYLKQAAESARKQNSTSSSITNTPGIGPSTFVSSEHMLPSIGLTPDPASEPPTGYARIEDVKAALMDGMYSDGEINTILACIKRIQRSTLQDRIANIFDKYFGHGEDVTNLRGRVMAEIAKEK